MKEIFLHEKDIPAGCCCCDFRDPKYNHCIASKDKDEYINCKQSKLDMNGNKPKSCPIHSIESIINLIK